ncbi:DUF1501 domain-containing protein [Nevskia sp.]|uniref:DUF1501 domain-containing protein n=1 Tax=Nevskia sp. TaxID=1929292 RepID=UPI0025FA536E|nr:DUF1501 domain-containing protein [Nevskia sp.]
MALHSDYKALVYVYLNGGLSTWQTLIPITDYTLYASRRAGTALPVEDALPINGTADGKAFGFHPNLPKLRTRFNAASPVIKSAIFHNIGNLVTPTTKAEALAGTDLPYQLFSHSDQTSQVQTAIPYQFVYGWGGRLSDYLDAQGFTQALPPNITVAGVQDFSRGADTNPYSVTTGGAVAPNTLGGAFGGAFQTAANALVQNAASSSNMNPISRFIGRVIVSSLNLEAVYNGAVAPANPADEVTTVFPDTSLGAQLRQVARQIAARSALNPPNGYGRDIFFVQLGGFDTHGSENGVLPPLLTIVDDAIDAFLEEVELLGVGNEVLTVEQSDFGRTLTSNGDGTDHAWGTFCLAWGGAVTAGHYGTPPDLTEDSDDDIGQGRFIPTMATSQFAASIAEWMGVPTVNLTTLFPTLANFGSPTIPFLP